MADIATTPETRGKDDRYTSSLLGVLMDTVSDGVFVLSRTGDDAPFVIEDANKALGRLVTGRVIGEDAQRVLPTKFADWLQERASEVLENGETLSARVSDKFDGVEHFLNVTLKPLSRKKQKVVATVRVITDSVRQREELRENRERFAIALEYAPYGVCFVGQDHMPLMVNRALAGWLDATMQTILQKPIEDYIHPDDRPLFARALQKILATGTAYQDVEVRLQTERGDQWVAVSMSQVASNAGGYVIIQFADITKRKQQEKELVKLATQDHLTGLANRMVFEDALKKATKRARRYNRHGVVLFIDLNDFKVVNDTYGHKAGDSILTEVGRVLTHTLRETDTIARIGGDEFAVIMDEACEKEAALKADLIEQEIANIKVMAHGKQVSIGASVGFHVFDGENVKSLEEIVACADKAMYAQKEASKARLRLVS